MAKYKKSVLQEVCDLLDTYKGRDKVHIWKIICPLMIKQTYTYFRF